MKESEKREYLARYKEQKEKGVPFFPDILFKDALVALLVFVLLAALAFFVGAPLEERANPADTNYNPRPEWYFLFLFQLLKYFPGEIEFVGVVLIPAVAILLLFLLPFLDRGPRRHFLNRPVVTTAVVLSAISFLGLSYQATREIPPPAEATQGDQTALLYAQNCASCHGPTIAVPVGGNLHDIIAQGSHEGMPSWSADLTADEIDALAGFILSPGGSGLFTDNCGACHDASELVATNPLELKAALDEGPDYEAHVGVDVPNWTDVLDGESRTALVNFLVAPDGQRLFAINCSPCHGQAVAFSGSEAELTNLISQGGMHLEMPPWREQLSYDELDTLAQYVVDPQAGSAGEGLFMQYCSSCHGDRVPAAEDVDRAREVIASGGSHETMPVWGDVLTAEQMGALVKYTLESSRGAPVETGRRLFSELCAGCHGEFGEGGQNPTRPDDIIAPISTAEYLATRDDFTLRAIIAQGQPAIGMSPFGSANGGPLDDEDINAIVAFLRTWEENPPVDMPPEITASATGTIVLDGPKVYDDLCAQCHGPAGAGGLAPALDTEVFQSGNTDEEIAKTISDGHSASSMIAWGEVLTTDQIRGLVTVIRGFGPGAEEAAAGTPGGTPSFETDVLPILDAQCKMCHGALGGWDGTSYESVMNSGDHAPVVVPGDADGSLLAQKVLGTQTEGTIMPPTGKMADEMVQTIVDWINAGAPSD